MSQKQMKGIVHGLKHRYAQPLRYALAFEEGELDLSAALGQTITLEYHGEIYCVHCGRKTKKSFNNGSCYPCFKKLPENDLCIVKPHECHFEQGTCRDEEWAKQHCMQPHYVYLAISSDLKVGLTRKHNQLKRWGDQGAVLAVPIAEVPDRRTAGELEMAIAEHIPDKTNWRKMLLGDIVDVDLNELRVEVLERIPDMYKPFILREEEMVSFTYPQLERIEKIKSYNLDKNPKLTDRLIGIKGQYLIFEQGVINMKKYSGYHLTVSLTTNVEAETI